MGKKNDANYSCEILSVSKEISPRERVKIKDTTNAISIDIATNGSEAPLVITPDFHAVLKIHNEKAEDTDYEKYIVVDKDGNKYVTGSASFWKAYCEIYDEMCDLEDDEPWSIEVYRVPSKNYAGKDFITCSLV